LLRSRTILLLSAGSLLLGTFALLLRSLLLGTLLLGTLLLCAILLLGALPLLLGAFALLGLLPLRPLLLGPLTGTRLVLACLPGILTAFGAVAPLDALLAAAAVALGLRRGGEEGEEERER